MINIRPATRDDCAAIVEIFHQGWHDGHADLVTADILPFRTPEALRAIYEASTDSYFVAERRGILGFVGVKEDELTKLFVAREARGSGVAVALMKFAEQKIAENGFSVAKLECQAGNIAAEKFYARNGWVVDRRVREDLWMPPGATDQFTGEAIWLNKTLCSVTNS